MKRMNQLRQLYSKQYFFYTTLTLSLAFGVGTISNTILSDDYAFIYSAKEFAAHAMEDGRPLSYLLINLTTLIPKEIVLLSLRIVGTCALLITAILVSSHIYSKSRLSRFWPFATMSFCIPAFQVYAQAAYAFPLAIALLLSTAAGLLILRDSKVYNVVGMFVLVAALSTYQMSALFALNLFVITLVSEYKSTIQLRRFVWNVFFLSCGILIYFATIVLLKNLINLDFKSRFSSVSLFDVPEKIVWFITRPLTLSFMPLTLRSPSVFEVIIFGGTTLALVILFLSKLGGDKAKRDNYTIYITYFSSQVISLSPLLFSRDNQIEPRMLIANQWINSFLLFSQASLSLEKIFFKLHRPWIGIRSIAANKVITISVAAILVMNSNYRFIEYIYKPYNSKVEFIEQMLQSCVDREKIAIIKRESSWPTRNMLGVWSQKTDLSSDWVPVPAVAFQLSRNSLNGIELLDAKEKAINLFSDTCIIYLQEFREKSMA